MTLHFAWTNIKDLKGSSGQARVERASKSIDACGLYIGVQKEVESVGKSEAPANLCAPMPR